MIRKSEYFPNQLSAFVDDAIEVLGHEAIKLLGYEAIGLYGHMALNTELRPQILNEGVGPICCRTH